MSRDAHEPATGAGVLHQAHPWWQWGILGVLGSLGLGAAVYASTGNTSTDFRVYMTGAQVLMERGSLYDFVVGEAQLPFTYPPFAAVLFIPLLHLPLRVAFVLWQLIEVAALVALSYVVATALPRLAGRMRPSSVGTSTLTLGVFGFSLACEPVAENFKYGQINILLVLLVIVDTAVLSRRRGILTGVATGIKVTPGIFMVLMMTTRRWRDLVLAIGSLGITLAIGAFFGIGQVWRYWTTELFQIGRVGDPKRLSNGSLNGIVIRAVGAPEATVVWAALATAVLIAGVWVATRWWRRDRLASATALGATALLISPLTWTHHWIWVIPLTAVLAALSVRAHDAGNRTEFAWLVVAAVLVALPFVGRARRLIVPITPDGSVLRLWVAGSYAMACLIGLAALAIASFRFTPTDEHPQEVRDPSPGAPRV